jgi:hypothetical protein
MMCAMSGVSESHHDHDHAHDGGINSVALSATLHCLTGCALGEIAGMVIGTALGLSNGTTIVLAIALAFLFGYSLTSLPLLRAGLALSVVAPIALASDTASIALMELIDNLIMVVIPGAMDSGLGDVLFWGALSFALVVAGIFAFPLNRYLIARGRGHAAVHKTGIHGGLPTPVVATAAVILGIFGSVVLIAEAMHGSGDGMGHGTAMSEHGGRGKAADPQLVRGTSDVANGLTLELGRRSVDRNESPEFRFRIVDERGAPVRAFEVEHEKRMHLIVARRDLTGFFHLHPKLGTDGEWSTELKLPTAGRWRVFTDFKHNGENVTLAADLTVDGPEAARSLPAPSARARTATGYDVEMSGDAAKAGIATELSFRVRRNGQFVDTEPYLGAGGHLVALRKGDLAFLHVHPSTDAHGGGAHAGVSFTTQFPSAGTYRLFLQFKHEGRVHTAAFTQRLSGG